ncbi:MAG: GDP-mannose 4,6-dehydratase [Anaerolineaceae bacterium]|nr:GDP-mannose 4,6-dehydratase [Anaerolineaceae bacterium]MBN2676972.1 GDP-mannose 4,6-dehydratase [Anaerolineaceae bacterium]
MAKYLVTGAAGFIASRVIEMLLDQGHEIHGIDNLNDSYDVRMKEYRLQQLEGRKGFTFRKMDISDREIINVLVDIPGKFDAIINLAARAGVRTSLSDPWVYINTNIIGTLNLVEFCRKKEIPKMILASTSSLYSITNPMPFKETAETDLPIQPYAASKKGAEALCYTYHYLYDLDVTVFRYFTVYGPAGRPDMVMFRFTQSIIEGRDLVIYGDGSQRRGFTYLDDIARGTILGLKPVGYRIINLGGQELMSLNELIAVLEQKTGKKARLTYQPFHKADALANWADVSKAREVLNWQPQVQLDEGISRLVDWYYKERSWASQV